MSFEFATATRIIFGDGSAGQLASLAQDLGSNALLFTDDQPERVDDLISVAQGSGTAAVAFFRYRANQAWSSSIAPGKGHCPPVATWSSASVAAVSIDSGKATSALIPNAGGRARLSRGDRQRTENCKKRLCPLSRCRPRPVPAPR